MKPLLAQLADDQVIFIKRGERNRNIGLFGFGVFQNKGFRAISDQNSQLRGLCQRMTMFGVFIDHGNGISPMKKGFGQRLGLVITTDN